MVEGFKSSVGVSVLRLITTPVPGSMTPIVALLLYFLPSDYRYRSG